MFFNYKHFHKKIQFKINKMFVLIYKLTINFLNFTKI